MNCSEAEIREWLKAPLELMEPGHRAPCVGCGYCCQTEVCLAGEKVYGEEVEPPCPGLIFKDGRFWCQLVFWADEEPPYGDFLRLFMSIDAGCTCPATPLDGPQPYPTPPSEASNASDGEIRG